MGKEYSRPKYERCKYFTGSKKNSCKFDEDEKESTMDASDGGYTYASNVDNHRSLMKDMCDIKSAASDYDWATAKDIYQNGKNYEKRKNYNWL